MSAVEQQGGAAQDGDRRTIDRESGTSPELRARLRRIRFVATTCALVLATISAVATLWLSNRIVSGKVSDTAKGALRDTMEIAKVVERMFAELEAIPQVLATSRAVREVVRRFNQREPAFAQMAQEQRRTYLTSDPEVVRLSNRLTQLRDRLRYDLLYVLDARGVRVVTADWDSKVELLGFDLSDRDYFTESMALRTAHQFAISRISRRPALFFSAPIEEEEKPIGAVVVRQTSEVIGASLAGGQDVKLIVDSAGMVVATSHLEFYLRHIPAADRAHMSGATKVNEAPDAGTLRSIYAQESLREIRLQRPSRLSAIDPSVHDAERVIDGHRYLVTTDPLKGYAGYSLFVFTPIDWVGETRRLHYIVGALFALFCALAILYAGRGANNLARQRHNARVTAMLNEKLTALNTEKDRYLGIAAHDLRNPLSSMRGLSELMLEAPLEPEQQREFLETIHRTSDEMLGLVNDLLDVSVIESGKLTLRRADHDVAKLVQQRIRHLEAHARSKKIDVTVDAPGVQRASIDTARFGQVIDNLVSNAIKFSPPSTAVRVALQSSNGNIAFSVQDQGPGIPEADRKLLFRSFQKLSARPTGGEKSTGLGLAIVKKIVDAHGGTIDVESGSGGGTRFVVTTPSTPPGGMEP